MLTKEHISQIAEMLQEVSRGEVRIAYQEEDQSTDEALTAHHFIKVNGKRLGRDIEVYAFMLKVVGPEQVLLELYEHWVLPLKGVGQCFPKGSRAIYECGAQHFAERGILSDWQKVFNYKKEIGGDSIGGKEVIGK